jgi:hypothetical protein
MNLCHKQDIHTLVKEESGQAAKRKASKVEDW